MKQYLTRDLDATIAACERLCGRSGGPVQELAPKLRVPVARGTDWLRGIRPLPGGTAEGDRRWFFEQVDAGLMHADDAEKLLERHRQLTLIEESDSAFVCKTCMGTPPAGFICSACGLG